MKPWLLLSLAAFACAAPDPVDTFVGSPPGPPLRRASPGPNAPRPRGAALGVPIDAHSLPLPLSVRASEGSGAPVLGPLPQPRALQRASVFRSLFPSITGATLDPDGGQRLAERLAEFSPSDVSNNGVALLTQDELWGTAQDDYEDALCEPLHFTFPFEEDGKSYEGSGLLWQYTYFDGDMLPFLVDLAPGCASALETQTPAEAANAPACGEEAELSFFREGTDCRACLDEGNPWSTCVSADRCTEEAPLVFWWYGYETGVQIPVEAHYAYMAACAPDWYVLSLAVAVADDDPAAPAAWDNPEWIGQCYPYWEPSINDIFFGCTGETLIGDLDEHVLAETAPFRLTGITKGRDPFPAYWDRIGWASSIAFVDGRTLGSFWAGFGAGPVTAPLSAGGWGVPPLQNRPGTTGDATDDLFARDFVASLTLKQSTLQEGIVVSFYNQNRCAPDGWVGPDEAGRYDCTSLRAPENDGWNYDGGNYWLDDAQTTVFQMPMLTLGSTGLPDPDVPGGFAIHVASAPGYSALEHWTYPHTFDPDWTAFPDVPQAVSDVPGALVQQTYRFGKDPAQDLRVVFAANWQRYHTPFGATEEAP